MSLDQSIRYAQPNSADTNNPQSLYEFIKPSRILVQNVDPIDTDGEILDYLINNVTGTFWVKDTNAIWQQLPFTFNAGSGGITNIVNDGTGAPLFKSIVTNVAHFRTLANPSGKVTMVTTANEINLGVSLNSSDVGLGNVQNIKSVFNAARAPMTLDNLSQGYTNGSIWVDTSTNPIGYYTCTSSTISAATWVLVGPSSLSTLLANVGTGAQIYVTGSSNPANIRSLISTSNKISIATTTNELNLGVNLNKNDVGLNLVTNIKNSYSNALDPTVNDDSTRNFSVGSLWLNQSPTLSVWYCNANAPGIAQWQKIYPDVSTDDFSFLFMQGASHQTAISSYGTRQLLNIGVVPYEIVKSRGGWATLDSGSGPVNIIWTPTNGLIGNLIEVTYNWAGFVANPATNDTNYVLSVNVGNGSQPNIGVIHGSSALIAIPEASRFASTTQTFVYQTTSVQTNFFVSIFASTGPALPVTLTTNQMTLTFRQL